MTWKFSSVSLVPSLSKPHMSSPLTELLNLLGDLHSDLASMPDKPTVSFEGSHYKNVFSLAFNSTNEHLFSCGVDSRINRFDVSRLGDSSAMDMSVVDGATWRWEEHRVSGRANDLHCGTLSFESAPPPLLTPENCSHGLSPPDRSEPSPRSERRPTHLLSRLPASNEPDARPVTLRVLAVDGCRLESRPCRWGGASLCGLQ